MDFKAKNTILLKEKNHEIQMNSKNLKVSEKCGHFYDKIKMQITI